MEEKKENFSVVKKEEFLPFSGASNFEAAQRMAKQVRLLEEVLCLSAGLLLGKLIFFPM